MLSKTVPDAFADPVWNALHSTHSNLAVRFGRACKYPVDVAPFSALEENTPEAMANLLALLEPDEATYVVGPAPLATKGLIVEPGPFCLRMDFPPNAPIPPIGPTVRIERLSCADAPAMVGLTDLAYPGYFRPRTCVMGNYYGVWKQETLVAMAGERMCPFPFRELSAVCTHPEHRGHGYAAALISHLLQNHRANHAFSTLWVVASNRNAIELYLRLGFQTTGRVQLHKITRANPGDTLSE